MVVYLVLSNALGFFEDRNKNLPHTGEELACRHLFGDMACDFAKELPIASEGTEGTV